MRLHGWLLVATLVAAPALAHAQAVLDKPHQILGEGVSLVVKGHYADAEKKLREALRLDPNLVEAHYNLGVALRELGRYDEAIAEYDQAAQMYQPGDTGDRAKALYGSALAKEARGDKSAWDAYLAFARPLESERPTVLIAMDHRDILNGIKPPGTQRAAR